MKTALVLMIGLLSLNATAQRWGFKDDALGETLQEFQSKYPKDDPDSCRKKMAGIPHPKNETEKDRSQRLDFYTNCISQQADVPMRSLGCFQTASQTNCAVVTTILGVRAAAFYQFLNGTLYMIQVPFGRSNFANVASAANEKYGKANDSGTRDYGNRFGAHANGRYILWQKGADTVALNEVRTDDLRVSFSGEILSALGSSFLLPQDPFETSVLLVIDSEAAKKLAQPKNPNDF